jgi:3-phenylpropionate/trans-cinnamate dioxygenase ferredoxin reductase component
MNAEATVGADGVLIAGGGLAAQRCAETLRRRGYDGPVTMVCAEPELPYDRPPLSKGGLGGDADDDAALHFRAPGWYADNAVELRLGARAVGLDPRRRLLELDSGDRLGYSELLIATGAAPRSLPLLDGFTNAHPLRTLDDARRLRAELAAGSRLAIVGAGFIGQEVAATALAAGLDVSVIEALELPLAPLLGDRVGRWLAELHGDEGARVLLSARLTEARGNGRVEELRLADGTTIACDAVVVGVGVAPAADWLAGTGLDPGGILTDEAGRTPIAHVFAAGDVCRALDPRRGVHSRTEHWDAAARQGAAAALAMLGEQPKPAPLPSFWSDQYGLRIQYVGHAEDADRIRVDGDPADRDFSVLYSRGDRPVAALTVARPRELIALRRLIEQDVPETPTKEMVG